MLNDYYAKFIDDSYMSDRFYRKKSHHIDVFIGNLVRYTGETLDYTYRLRKIQLDKVFDKSTNDSIISDILYSFDDVREKISSNHCMDIILYSEEVMNNRHYGTSKLYNRSAKQHTRIPLKNIV